MQVQGNIQLKKFTRLLDKMVVVSPLISQCLHTIIIKRRIQYSVITTTPAATLTATGRHKHEKYQNKKNYKEKNKKKISHKATKIR